MERDFEKFQGGPSEAASKRVHVTISPQKLIHLNRNMYHQLGKPDAVYLHFSRTRDNHSSRTGQPAPAAIVPGHAKRPRLAYKFSPVLPPFRYRHRHDPKIHPPRDRRQCPLPKTRRNHLRRRTEEAKEREKQERLDKRPYLVLYYYWYILLVVDSCWLASKLSRGYTLTQDGFEER